MRESHFRAGHYGASRLLTTADVARMLEVTTWVVRWLARTGQLVAGTTTPSGQRLFRKWDVLRLAETRAEARLRNVRALRPKILGVPGEPHQLSLFGSKCRPAKARLRLVVDRDAVA